MTPADLADMDMVSLPEGSIQRRWVEDAFAAEGLACRHRFTVDSNLIAVRLVEAGLGYSIMHPVRPENLTPGVAVRPFEPRIAFTYALLERADQPGRHRAGAGGGAAPGRQRADTRRASCLTRHEFMRSDRPSA